ncbi:unnamed protein product [Prorocentrum cordatum]|uniref:Uncharacterized protein n=1 Tax=Prorocentrum cordatum TaxID=2364126 RepID=A0ABN9WA43_9DINO|nr:unnamed protein product [Polarella glacialis]
MGTVGSPCRAEAWFVPGMQGHGGRGSSRWSTSASRATPTSSGRLATPRRTASRTSAIVCVAPRKGCDGLPAALRTANVATAPLETCDSAVTSLGARAQAAFRDLWTEVPEARAFKPPKQDDFARLLLISGQVGLTKTEGSEQGFRNLRAVGIKHGRVLLVAASSAVV